MLVARCCLTAHRPAVRSQTVGSFHSHSVFVMQTEAMHLWAVWGSCSRDESVEWAEAYSPVENSLFHMFGNINITL